MPVVCILWQCSPSFIPDCQPVLLLSPLPSIPTPNNSRIVQRSSYLNSGYGSDFKYREAMSSPSVLGAGAMSAGMAAVGAMFALGPLRNIAKK
jgi:hypothetical protein